jgi:hypothetical protein
MAFRWPYTVIDFHNFVCRQVLVVTTIGMADEEFPYCEILTQSLLDKAACNDSPAANGSYFEEF